MPDQPAAVQASPSSTAIMIKAGIGLATSLMGGGGIPWVPLTAIAAVVGMIGVWGVTALKDAESSLLKQGEATAKLSDLTAALAERDSLAKRLDQASRDTVATIATLQTAHEARLAAIEAAATTSAKAAASCPIDLNRAKVIK